MNLFNALTKKSNKSKIVKGKAVYAAETILTNDNINIVADACKVCWGTKGYTTYSEKCEYIAKRIKTGHESVIEHSNMVIQMVFPAHEMESVLAFMSAAQYLNKKARVKGENIYLLVGGSIRGYKEAFRNMLDMTNVVLDTIRTQIYMNLDKCYFADFIQDGIMNDHSFGYYPDEETEVTGYCNKVEVEDDRVTIVNVDNIDEAASKMYDVFTFDDLLDMMTVTIIFDKMSRIITQQLTRHRNGITQESGRYVDLREYGFNSPDKFKPKYEADKTYFIERFKEYFTLKDLGDALMDIYEDLREQGLDKEDARGYLPQNYASGKVYMTFTYRHLLKFLQLRTHKSAQPEIKQYADVIDNAVMDSFRASLNTINVYKYLDPMYLGTRISPDYTDVDSHLTKKIHTVEEEIEVSEDGGSEEVILNTVDKQEDIASEDI